MSRAERKLQPTPGSLASLEFVEGMARIRGYDAFRIDPAAEICWHCHGQRVCNCAGCVEFTCLVCRGAGLVTWLAEG